jgi:hypothetical protein
MLIEPFHLDAIVGRKDGFEIRAEDVKTKSTKS